MVLLFELFLASAAAAQAGARCEDGISVLDTMAYVLLADEALSDADVTAYRQQLAACSAHYRFFSPGKRKDFLQMLDQIMERVDSVYLRVSSEGFYRPDGPTPEDERRAVRINQVRESLQKRYIALLNERYLLDKGWSKPFLTRLIAGYESTDVDGYESYGNGRFGFNYYFQANGPLSRETGWGRHLFGEAMLTNTAESSGTGVDNAYELDINFYAARLVVDDRRGGWAVGPVGGIKMIKLDGISTSQWKYMGGVRLARSPDLYIDTRYGKTEGVSGHRIEVRGQLPVMALFNGDVIVGGMLNISSDDSLVTGDTMRFYLLWQVNFLNVLNVY